MNLAFGDREMSMRIRFEHPVSDDALMRFSSENDPLRFERDANGELIVMTPVNSDGGAIEGEVHAELIVWSRADGRGKAFGSSAGFTLPDTSIRAADAAWMSLTRWNALTRDQQQSYAPVCPEFVIEVRSKSDRLPTIEAKMQMWIDNGAELAWLIDPERRVVAIYRCGDARRFFTTQHQSKAPAPSQASNSSCPESGSNRPESVIPSQPSRSKNRRSQCKKSLSRPKSGLLRTQWRDPRISSLISPRRNPGAPSIAILSTRLMGSAVTSSSTSYRSQTGISRLP